MPWLSIIMAILGFLTSLKANPQDKGRAIATAALAGLGTYYVSHETDWGQDLLGPLDGVTMQPPITGGIANLPDGSQTSTGQVGVPSVVDGKTNGLWKTLTSWGATGTAGVIGATGLAAGVATGNIDTTTLIKWGAIGLAAYLVLKG